MAKSTRHQEYIYFMGSGTLLRTYILYGVGNVSSYTLWGRDPENISFIASGFLLPVTYFPTIPSACYILFDEASIPFYFTSTGYKHQSYN